MYSEIEKYGYKYFSKPPYEVFSNNFVSFADIIKLKNLEKLLDYYYNSEQFEKSVDWVIDNFYNSNPFLFYNEISQYYEEKGYLKVSHKDVAIFNFLNNFYLEKGFSKKEIFTEYLKYDFLKVKKSGVHPHWLKDEKDGELYDKLIKEKNYRTVREGHKNSEFARFSWNVIENREEDVYIFFDYRDNSCQVVKILD
nr:MULTISPECIES: DUF4080 domain-containing protein [unclassified Fusobacterium]